jgi:hypothetical protein
MKCVRQKKRNIKFLHVAMINIEIGQNRRDSLLDISTGLSSWPMVIGLIISEQNYAILPDLRNGDRKLSVSLGEYTFTYSSRTVSPTNLNSPELSLLCWKGPIIVFPKYSFY